ncbi:MAG: rod shape-determining protein RodA [Actinomycetota bacterium]|jgi:rod shape determining protein RodA|nr:rod shape-determining protein RodA [Actinomycetota bacterium]
MIRSAQERLTSRVSVPLLVFLVLLLVYGAVLVQSATSGFTAGSAMFRRQLLGMGIGLIPLAVAWGMDYTKLKGWLGPLVLLDALLIISPRIPGLGYSAGGATSWLAFGGIRLFQPSEPAKLVTIVVMAAVISQYKGRLQKPADVFRVAAYLMLPVGLILLQPDLGTGLVFIAIALGMLLVGGLQARWFALFGVVMILAGILVFALPSEYGGLKEYQRNRLLVFIDNEVDPRGAGYNLAQSKIAIGSGGLTGKGLGSGTQSNLNFLPERHTDFIFAVLGEETGFAGTMLLLALYLGLLVTALEIATSSRDLFGSLIAAGVISMWTFQVMINAGMNLGIMPITGIPLPFMSFGSSFMVTNLGATGMLLSVWARRYGAR